MDEPDRLAERFDANRTHLRAVADRMLGSRSEAEDAVQEAWLRLSRSETSGVENLRGWLTVVARVCLDLLRSRKARREEKHWLRPSGWRSCCTTCSDLPFDEIAPIAGRSPTAARQLASRARRRVQGAAPAPGADRARQREIVVSFLAASREGDFDARCWRCWTRTWCSEPTARRFSWAPRRRSAGRRPWATLSRAVPGPRSRRW